MTPTVVQCRWRSGQTEFLPLSFTRQLHAGKSFGLNTRAARGSPEPLAMGCRIAYFWYGARTFSISAWAFFMPSSGVYFSSRISWNVVTKMFRIFQLSWVLISGEA